MFEYFPFSSKPFARIWLWPIPRGQIGPISPCTPPQQGHVGKAPENWTVIALSMVYLTVLVCWIGVENMFFVFLPPKK